MKKKLIYLWILLLCLTGCTFALKDDELLQKISEISGTVASEFTENSNDESTDEDSSQKENTSITGENYSGTYCYYYDLLEEPQKVLYNEIYDTIIRFQRDVELSSIDKEEIDQIFNCVLYDHPEIFYVTGYSYTQHTLNDTITRIDLTPTFQYTEDQVIEKQSKIDQYVSDCLIGIPMNMDEYEITKYIYEYLIKNTVYDLNADDNQNICSVFINGRSICQGYAKATQYLLNKLNVDTTLVTGYITQSGDGHAWNLVLIDGEYYYIDTTWGDAHYSTDSDQEQTARVPEVSYDYLNITTGEIQKTHSISELFVLPECTSMTANYYVHEDAYFVEVNEDQIASLFENAYVEDSGYVTMKCMNKSVYDAIYQYLINDQNIFNYLEGTTSISYTGNVETYTYSFWI